MVHPTRAIETLILNPKNPRTHSKKQVRQIARSIQEFGFQNPILIDNAGRVIAGHGRIAAAKLLGLTEVPVKEVGELSDAKKRALGIADNKLADNAGWDRELLAIEIPKLSELLTAEGLDIEIMGFAAPEIDQILIDFEENSSDPGDEIDPGWETEQPVSRHGDHWRLGEHDLLCGDARNQTDVARLMGEERADMGFADVPYNLAVASVTGRGRIKHSEFAMASGEMSCSEYRAFLEITLSTAARVSRSGAVHFVCQDWRHISDLIEVARPIYSEMLNLAIWAKTTAGQGSFYRSQHELIGIFRVGGEAHLNNIQLGRHGRSRSNLWTYPGANTFRKGRIEELKLHPTIKPIALVVDAIRDCTQRGDIVLDPFCGSGTTVLAAERVGRRARALEIEPRYVDVAIRRWQAFTRRDAVHAETNLTFDELSEDTAKGRRAGASASKAPVRSGS